jgi:hypothetical protein
MDYNRVRIRMLKLIPQIKNRTLWKHFAFPDVFESYDIEQTIVL